MTHRLSETASRCGPTQSDPAGPACNPGQSFEEKVRRLESERAHLSEKLQEMRNEQQHLLERYVGLEEQNSTLTTLYVACQRLHSSLDRAEVLLTVREIIVNLVGCEEFVIFGLSQDGWLRRLDSFGVDPERYEKVLPGNGLIGKTIESGETYLKDQSDKSSATRVDENLTACIPLKRNGAVKGAIAMFRLLPQKPGLQELDRELFWLLETHLALALRCSELNKSVRAGNGVTA
jgi:nitrate/nitrite-specific signal transduction histidine kinase